MIHERRNGTREPLGAQASGRPSVQARGRLDADDPRQDARRPNPDE